MFEIPYLVVVFVGDSLSLVCGEYIGGMPMSQQSTQNIFQNNPGPVSRDVLRVVDQPAASYL
jgi:uncharacterized protein YneF (UPF0154 family)